MYSPLVTGLKMIFQRVAQNKWKVGAGASKIGKDESGPVLGIKSIVGRLQLVKIASAFPAKKALSRSMTSWYIPFPMTLVDSNSALSYLPSNR